MSQHFYSNGKLLLTGEYLVLMGGEAIALPLKMGQRMTVKPMEGTEIQWKSNIQGENRFKARFDAGNFSIIESNDAEKANYIEKLLSTALPDEKRNGTGYEIESHLDFPFEWGFGSSSTLINNIAQWQNLDAFDLNKAITHGSGYDIACAKSKRPIIYQLQNGKPAYSNIKLNPAFKKNLYFVYTGKKKSSKVAVKAFMNRSDVGKNTINELSAINQQILNASNLDSFEDAVKKHERLIAGILQNTHVLKDHFPDFPGEMKSLGAWGGDFVLVTWRDSQEKLKETLEKYNLFTIFKWNEIVLNYENHA